MRRKKIMLKSISDNAIFERNVWLKNEKANSCFHKSFKRKLHKFSDENKENTVSAPKRKFLDFDSDFDINSKKEHFKYEENLPRQLNSDYLSLKKLDEYNQIPLNMQCYSDLSYDLWLNNLVENEFDHSAIQKGKEIPNQNCSNASGIVFDESFENLFSITHEFKSTDQLNQNDIIPFELYDADELEELEKKEIREEKKSAPKRKLSHSDMSPHLEKSEAPDINSLAKKFKFEEKIAEASELNFGIQLIPKIFTLDEIKTGIFGNKNNNSTSSTQSPFDADKVEDFKNQIAKKFNYSLSKMEVVWEYLRIDFNKKLHAMRKKLNNDASKASRV